MKQLGFISNNKTSALIDKGNIVWLPLPRFDSPSLFTRLLDEEGGEFSIYLEEEPKMSYVYPNVLKTEAQGVEIIDIMPKGESGIIRYIKTEKPLKAIIKPLFNYGLYKPIIEERKRGFRFLNPIDNDCLALISDKIKRTGYFEWEILPGEIYIYLIYSSDEKYGPFNKGSSLIYDLKHSFRRSFTYWKNFYEKIKLKIRKIY